MWDTWDVRDKVQGDDMLEYDSFYNGFMAPYFSYYDTMIQREQRKLYIWILMVDVICE